MEKIICPDCGKEMIWNEENDCFVCPDCNTIAIKEED